MKPDSYRSLGQLCEDLQAPYATLAAIVDEQRIAETFTLNRKRYFGLKAVEEITAALAAARNLKGKSQ
jgi:hypothetical protein